MDFALKMIYKFQNYYKYRKLTYLISLKNIGMPGLFVIPLRSYYL